MESSVRYVQLENAGFKPALCFRGKKVAHCLINDESRIRVIEISLPDHDKAGIVKRLGHDYMPKAFADAMKKVGERKAMTKRAVELLAHGSELDDETVLPPDEVDAERDIGIVLPEFMLPVAPSKAPPEKPSPARIRAPRRVDPPKQPAQTVTPPVAAPKAPKAAKAKQGGKTLVSVLAAELGIAEQPCRVKLRAAGLRAPYDDEAKMRKALGLKK